MVSRNKATTPEEWNMSFHESSDADQSSPCLFQKKPEKDTQTRKNGPRFCILTLFSLQILVSATWHQRARTSRMVITVTRYSGRLASTTSATRRPTARTRSKVCLDRGSCSISRSWKLESSTLTWTGLCKTVTWVVRKHTGVEKTASALISQRRWTERKKGQRNKQRRCVWNDKITQFFFRFSLEMSIMNIQSIDIGWCQGDSCLSSVGSGVREATSVSGMDYDSQDATRTRQTPCAVPTSLGWSVCASTPRSLWRKLSSGWKITSVMWRLVSRTDT